MLKIGDRELTNKDIAVVVILFLVAVLALWVMLGSWRFKPKPVIGAPPPASAAGLVLLEGGQPGSGPRAVFLSQRNSD